MRILSTFPALLTFGMLAPFLLRIIVAFFLLHLAKKRLKSKASWMSVAYFLPAIFLVLGVYTQIASIVGFFALKTDFYLDFWKNKKNSPISKETYFLYLFAEIILLSLLFTGPGFLAFDLPL